MALYEYSTTHSRVISGPLTDRLFQPPASNIFPRMAPPTPSGLAPIPASSSPATALPYDMCVQAPSHDVKLLTSLSQTADMYGAVGLNTSAIFFAHQAHSFSPSSSTSLRLARLHAGTGDFRKALHLVLPNAQAHGQIDAHARLLAAQCLFELFEYDMCLSLLGDDDCVSISPIGTLSLDPSNSSHHVQAAMSVLRGRVHEYQGNATRAITCYKRALRTDIFCIDAFDRIVNASLIAPDDVRDFVCEVTESLAHAEDPAVRWLCSYYRAASDRNAPLPKTPSALTSSLEVLHVVARRAFDSFDFKTCESVIRSMLTDSAHLPHIILTTYLATLVELGDRQKLFEIAHKLVASEPKAAIPWLAVGYYYFASDKPSLCRNFLRKATEMDSRLAPAWVALGHAFAMQDESDQAMAAYRTANRLFPGAQLPPLFMGMECARQGSLAHASLLFQTAMRACNSDPAPRHELGVVAYQQGHMARAAAYFKEALSLWEASDGVAEVTCVTGRRADAEEATLVNLGHCYRRLTQFGKAKRCYERALSLRSRSPATCTALGMTLHAMGDLGASVVMYHRALRDNPADAVCNELLERALRDLSDGDGLFENLTRDSNITSDSEVGLPAAFGCGPAKVGSIDSG